LRRLRIDDAPENLLERVELAMIKANALTLGR
jgi:hypothetical protein